MGLHSGGGDCSEVIATMIKSLTALTMLRATVAHQWPFPHRGFLVANFHSCLWFSLLSSSYNCVSVALPVSLL